MRCDIEKGSEAWSPEEVKDAVSGLLNLLTQSQNSGSNGRNIASVCDRQRDLASSPSITSCISAISNESPASTTSPSLPSLKCSDQKHNQVLSSAVHTATALCQDLTSMPKKKLRNPQTSLFFDKMGFSQAQSQLPTLLQDFHDSTRQNLPTQVTCSKTDPLGDPQVRNEVFCSNVKSEGSSNAGAAFGRNNGSLGNTVRNVSLTKGMCMEQVSNPCATVAIELSSCSDTDDSIVMPHFCNFGHSQIDNESAKMRKRKKDMSKEEELNFKRERNRLHAQKSREKKRNEVAEIKSEVKTLKNENRALRMLLIHEMGRERAEEAFKNLT